MQQATLVIARAGEHPGWTRTPTPSPCSPWDDAPRSRSGSCRSLVGRRRRHRFGHLRPDRAWATIRCCSSRTGLPGTPPGSLASAVTGPLRATSRFPGRGGGPGRRLGRRRPEWPLRPGPQGDIALSRAPRGRRVRRHQAPAMVAEGHQRVSSFAIVGSGPNAASPHHDATPRVIRSRGRPWSAAFGEHDGNGYCSRHHQDRVHRGEPPSRLRVRLELYSAVLQGAQSGSAVAGGRCRARAARTS